MNALLVIAHGSRNAQFTLEIENLILELRRSAQTFDTVAYAFLEFAQPDIQTAMDNLIKSGSDNITVLPYFLARGNHVERDIPDVIDKIKSSHPDIRINTIAHVGQSKDMAALIINHVENTSGRR